MVPESIWQRKNVVAYLLWPLSALYRCVLAMRRLAYRSGWITVHQFDPPVVVVGNISVGGTGKTPIVSALANRLADDGWKPGIVSRGYGGKAESWPQRVDESSAWELVGDEPVLLARRTRCPVVVGPNRPEAVRELLASYDCNLVISDDGLQHLALHRDIELVVVDGQRGFGNGFCLPAGPLREPKSRLQAADFVIYNGDGGQAKARCDLVGDVAVNLINPNRKQPIREFHGENIHAVAGIGNPLRFFTHLKDNGVEAIEHAFPDHHRFTARDLEFGEDSSVLMTEKDAVKCTSFATHRMWYVPVEARLDEDFFNEFCSRLEEYAR